MVEMYEIGPRMRKPSTRVCFAPSYRLGWTKRTKLVNHNYINHNFTYVVSMQHFM